MPARWRHSSPRPPPPQRARSPSWPPAVLHGQLSDPLHGAIQFRLHRIALALLERGVDPAGRFLTPLLEPEDLYAQLARQKLHRLVSKSRRTTSRLRATVHRWPSPSGPAGKAWPGENVDEPSSPAFTTGPSTATFFSKLSVMFRSSLDTSIKPILCPRKSGPTHHVEPRPNSLRHEQGIVIGQAGNFPGETGKFTRRTGNQRSQSLERPKHQDSTPIGALPH